MFLIDNIELSSQISFFSTNIYQGVFSPTGEAISLIVLKEDNIVTNKHSVVSQFKNVLLSLSGNTFKYLYNVLATFESDGNFYAVLEKVPSSTLSSSIKNIIQQSRADKDKALVCLLIIFLLFYFSIFSC